MSRVAHQFAPVLEPGAVGKHMLEVQAVLRKAGITSEIFVAEARDAWADRCHPIDDYGSKVPAAPTDIVIYQYAIGSPVADLVQTYPGTLVVNSHNQTPPELMRGWDPGGTYGASWGMRQLRELAPMTRLGIADSEFNAGEMRDAGYRDVTVVPVFVDHVEAIPDPTVVASRPAAGARWLFVGRIAPNKKQQDIIRALAAYRRAYDPDAHLVIVGGGLDSRFGRALQRFTRDLGLEDAVQFTGPVSDEQLAGYFASADVFVCMSEHEGFCVPLLEAMRADVPVVAFASTAVPETMAGAGIVLDSKRPSIVAAAVHRVIEDGDLRKALIERGRIRSDEFSADRLERALLEALEPLFA